MKPNNTSQEILHALHSQRQQGETSLIVRIEANHIHFFNNRLIGVDKKVAYRSYAAYGAKSKGWKGVADITNLVNDGPVPVDATKALRVFK